jgi:hypothetical protein
LKLGFDVSLIKCRSNIKDGFNQKDMSKLHLASTITLLPPKKNKQKKRKKQKQKQTNKQTNKQKRRKEIKSVLV